MVFCVPLLAILAIASPPKFDIVTLPTAGFGGGENGLQFLPRVRGERP